MEMTDDAVLGHLIVAAKLSGLRNSQIYDLVTDMRCSFYQRTAEDALAVYETFFLDVSKTFAVGKPGCRE